MKLLQHGLVIAEAGAAPVARDLLIDGDTILDLLEPGTRVPDAARSWLQLIWREVWVGSWVGGDP